LFGEHFHKINHMEVLTLKLDSKQKVLVAIYIEYQKDIPNMFENITSEKLGMSKDVFNIAVEKLQSEELIKDANVSHVMGLEYPDVLMDFTKMTRLGIEYIENKMDIEKTLTNEEKTKNVIKKLTEWGYEQLQSLAAKTLAELIRGQ
jgi:hypothetical protein